MNDKDTESFNEIYRELCSEIGLEKTMLIYHLYHGQQITFPVHLYNSRLVCLKIGEEFDGTNAKELAKKYNFSEKTVRRMLKSRGKQ